jgi:hypothetical protein
MKVNIECDEKEAILMLSTIDLLPRLHTIKERIRRCLKDDTPDLIYECVADIDELLVNLE